MGESGADIKLSPAARKQIPYRFEAKNQERVNVWAAYDQAQEHEGDGEAVVVIKKNHRVPLVLIDAEYFIRMIGNVYNDGPERTVAHPQVSEEGA